MPKLQNLLKRRRDVPVDPEIHERLVKRLASLRAPFASGTEGAAVKPDADSGSAQELPIDDPIALATTYQSLFVDEPPAIDAVDQVDSTNRTRRWITRLRPSRS